MGLLAGASQLGAVETAHSAAPHDRNLHGFIVWTGRWATLGTRRGRLSSAHRMVGGFVRRRAEYITGKVCYSSEDFPDGIGVRPSSGAAMCENPKAGEMSESV